MENIILFIKSVITIMIPVFFASCGGLFTSLSGTLNIALEGLLLAGAFSSLAVFYFTGNYFLAVLSAVIAAVILAALHAACVFKIKTNLFICGLAINLLSSGICVALSEKLFKTKGVVALDINQKLLSANNLLSAYVITGIVMLVISWIAIYKTPFGYRLRSCGKNKDALVSLGMNPDFFKAASLIISGVFCGIGGSFLSLNLAAYVPGMSSGRGWISLAVIFLGLNKPLGLLAAAFVFASAEAFSNYAQGFWSIPADFILSLPYICSLIAMILVSIFSKKSVT